MSGGQAGVLPRGTAKRCQPLERLGGPEQENLLSRVCRGWGLCSGVSGIWSSRRKPDAEPFVGEGALTREMGSERDHCQSGHQDQPHVLPSSWFFLGPGFGGRD